MLYLYGKNGVILCIFLLNKEHCGAPDLKEENHRPLAETLGAFLAHTFLPIATKKPPEQETAEHTVHPAPWHLV